MRTSIACLAMCLAALGCTSSTAEAPAQGTVEAKSATPAASGSPAQPTPAPAKPAAPPTSIVVAVHDGDGALAPLLAEHAAKAKRANLDPYVEFTADWCKPCVEFKKYLDDPQMKSALTGTYIVMVDYDAYGNEATAMGVRGIPTWIELDEAGKSTGRNISSGVWGEDIPANMAPPLKAFFSAGKP